MTQYSPLARYHYTVQFLKALKNLEDGEDAETQTLEALSLDLDDSFEDPPGLDVFDAWADLAQYEGAEPSYREDFHADG